MLRPILTLAAVGVVGVALWQVLFTLLLPLLGTVVGFLVTLAKIAFLILLVLVAVWLFKRITRQAPENAA
jgi:hypothetical protein